MYAAERQQRIVHATHTDGRVDVVSLAQILDVTAETIRRDLAALEARGLLRRVHGGALPVSAQGFEPTLATRAESQVTQKQQIAKAALPLIDTGVRSVLLDAGTTTSAFARELIQLTRGGHDLTVVTNSLGIASIVAGEPHMHLHLLGGRIRERTMAAVGPSLSSQLSDLVVDVAFLGANGLHVRRGLTTPNEDEAHAKRAMASCADSVIVLADAEKIGQTHLSRVLDVEAIDTVVTDSEIDDDAREELVSAGTEVVVA